MAEKRLCPSCREEMTLRYAGVLYMKEKLISTSPDYIRAELYRCPRCRHLEWVEPITPVEQLEQEQAEQEGITDPVRRFEHTFRDYSEKQLQKVVDGKGYVEDAKKAVRNLLRRREK